MSQHIQQPMPNINDNNKNKQQNATQNQSATNATNQQMAIISQNSKKELRQQQEQPPYKLLSYKKNDQPHNEPNVQKELKMTEINYDPEGFQLIQNYINIIFSNKAMKKQQFCEMLSQINVNISISRLKKDELAKLCIVKYNESLQNTIFLIDLEQLYVQNKLMYFIRQLKQTKFNYKLNTKWHKEFINWLMLLIDNVNQKNQIQRCKYEQEFTGVLKELYELIIAYQLPILPPFQDMKLLKLYQNQLLNSDKYKLVYQQIFNDSQENIITHIGTTEIIEKLQNKPAELQQALNFQSMVNKQNQHISLEEQQYMEVLIYLPDSHEVLFFKQDLFEQFQQRYPECMYNEKTNVIYLRYRQYDRQQRYAFLIRKKYNNEIINFYMLFIRSAMLLRYNKDFDIIPFTSIFKAMDLSRISTQKYKDNLSKFDVTQLQERFKQDPTLFTAIFERYKKHLGMSFLTVNDIIEDPEKDNDDIQQEVLQINCIDPITFNQLDNPVRGGGCTHLHCFKYYKNKYPYCPICKRKITQFHSDLLMQKLILYACVNYPNQLIQQIDFDISHHMLVIKEIRVQQLGNDSSGWFSDQSDDKEMTFANQTLQTNKLDVIDLSDSEEEQPRKQKVQTNYNTIQITNDNIINLSSSNSTHTQSQSYRQDSSTGLTSPSGLFPSLSEGIHLRSSHQDDDL